MIFYFSFVNFSADDLSEFYVGYGWIRDANLVEKTIGWCGLCKFEHYSDHFDKDFYISH